MIKPPPSFPPLVLPESSREARKDIRRFLAYEASQGNFKPKCDAWLSGFDPTFSKHLGDQGFIGMTWPARYGGGERSALDRYVVTEELLTQGAPVAAHWIADRQTGPLLLKYGSEEQRQRYLPGIARGEIFFSLGMSEPDSGSDLASIRTKAVEVEGGWRVTGSKIWTSQAHHNPYMMALVRTGPGEKHADLSQMIIALDAPGVNVRPIRLISGEEHFSEVFLDDVFVSQDSLVGGAGAGWEQVTTELALERSGPERFLSTYPLLERLLEQPELREDKGATEALGRVFARLATLRRMSLGTATIIDQGGKPNLSSAIVKDLGTLFEKDVIEVARSLENPSLSEDEVFRTLFREARLAAPGFTLRGGTTEILRVVIAKELGL